MPGPEYDDVELDRIADAPTADVPGSAEKLRHRLLDQLETETDEAALQGAELALVALREPLEPGPITALLHYLADHLEAAMQRQDDELRDLRRKLQDKDGELRRLRPGGGVS